MSIISGTGAVHLTKDVHSAMLAVTSNTSSFDSGSTPLFMPFCTLKLVDGSQSTFTIDVALTMTPHPSRADAGAVPPTWESLVVSLPCDQCCMAVAQVLWRAHSDSVVCTWLVFLLWAPDSTSTKEHMLVSMFSKGAKIDQPVRHQHEPAHPGHRHQ